MKIFKMAKAAIRAMHKRRSRKRKGGVAKETTTYNAAKALVDSNWGLAFRNPKPERKGVRLACARLAAKRKANALIPSGYKLTRQQQRHSDRKMFKPSRSVLSTLRP